MQTTWRALKVEINNAKLSKSKYASYIETRISDDRL